MLRITAFSDGDWRTVPFETLERDFLSLCESHRAQGRALAFAFILFDRSHPYVRSALAQQHYWDALDERSGRHISVFSLDVRPPATLGVEKRSMHAVQSPTPGHITAALSSYFEGLGEVTLPCVMFFQVKAEQVIDRAIVTLAASGLAETYRELEAVIGSAADAVAGVSDDNTTNAAEIFNLVTRALNEREQRKGLVRLYHTARPAAEIAGVLELLRLIFGG